MDYSDELKTRLSEISAETAESRRACLLGAAKSFFAEKKDRLRRTHCEGAGGAAVVSGYTALADAMVESIYAAAIAEKKARAPHALIALGGYGRSELCFCSDLDIMLVHEGRLDKGLEALNDYVLYFLWDLGFEVGHSIRSIGEALMLGEADDTILTSMLESRLLAGDESTFERFVDGLSDRIDSEGAKRFIRRIKRKRARACRESGDEVYHAAPNVKHTAGGLRDYHTGVWIALTRFGVKSPRELFDTDLLTDEQFLRLERALDFMWRVRNQIYFEDGPYDDALTLNRQERIARAFGYRASRGALEVELFMQDYYVHAHELRMFYEEMLHLAGVSGARRALPAVPRGGKTERGLRIAHRHVYLPAKDMNWLRQNPARLMEIIWYSQKRGFALSESALQSMKANLGLIDDRFREDPVARDYFMAILSDPLRVGSSVRLMSDIGILDRYLPEFASIRNVVRYHHFHQHPVSEHTLRALENLAEIPRLSEPGSDAIKRALSEIKAPAILSLAVLLHDLGKAEDELHAEAGARIAKNVGERLALNTEQTGALVFLVRDHTKMTHLSRYRDPDDPEIIRRFAFEASSVENLNMLYLLTYADLRAVRKGAWSDWISALLFQLYGRARQALDTPASSEEQEIDCWDTPKAGAICEYLKKGDPSAVEEHLRGMSPRYFASFSAREIAEHIQMAASLRNRRSALKWAPAPNYSLSHITVCTKDRPGLFAEIVGSFASQQVSVLEAAAFTRSDGVAIDSFHVIDGRTDGPLTSTKWAVVKENLRKALRGERDVARLIRRAERSPLAAQKTMSSLRRGVFFDNGVSSTHTVIDIEAPDRIGLLYDIASTLFELGLDISVARIATDGRQARDAFYVVDREGNKIEDPLPKRDICRKIEEVIDAGRRAEAPADSDSGRSSKRKSRTEKKRRMRT